MAIRVGFDVDGVIADFASSYREIEERLFPDRPGRADEPEREEREQEQREIRSASDAADPAAAARETPSRELRRRRDLIWKQIQATSDFWTTLRPIQPDGVRRIHEMMIRHRWEVFFITQR